MIYATGDAAKVPLQWHDVLDLGIFGHRSSVFVDCMVDGSAGPGSSLRAR